jgi:hypothetical protein
MWRGPFFTQVFASHFNATASRVPVPALASESQGYEGAMALAAAAVGVQSGSHSMCLHPGSSNAHSPYSQTVRST